MNVLESQSEPSIAGENAKRLPIPMRMGVQKQAIPSRQINKIPFEIRKGILEICNRPEYASMAPYEIVPVLADEGIYQVLQVMPAV